MLLPDACHSIKELHKDRADIRDVSGRSVVAVLGESVTKREPVLFNEHLEPLHGTTVVGV